MFCNVLGIWLRDFDAKCAHIVPLSFDTIQLPYLFGTEQAALESPRNGLILHKAIEEAFDYEEIAIVPHGSIDVTPTEWKVIVLQTSLLDKTCYQDPFTGKITKWEELHHKPLEWQNDNRPARRYLYLQYLLAWMAARRAGYPGWQQKLPPGTIWATPDKQAGYLRRSILRVLARKMGDSDPLPADIVEAGGFDDPDTATMVKEQVTAIVVPRLFREYLDRKRARKRTEEEDGEKQL